MGVLRPEEEELINGREMFINDEYTTNSQYTELYMILEGLDYYSYDPDAGIDVAYRAAKKYEKEKSGNLKD